MVRSADGRISPESRTTGSRSWTWERCVGGARTAEDEEGPEEDWDEEEWEEDWADGQVELAQSPGGTRPRPAAEPHLRHVSPDGSREEAAPWITTKAAELLFGIVVTLNTALIGFGMEAEIRWGERSSSARTMYFVQCAFALVFAVELILRIRAKGCAWCRSINGIFDIIMVLITVIDLGIISPIARFAAIDGIHLLSLLRALQITRLACIVWLFRASCQLGLLLLGLRRSLRSVFWVFVMLFVVIYICALFCAGELGTSNNDNLKNAFGSIWLSMYSHFKIITLESWPDICGWAMEQNRLWAFYFIGYILITNLALLNLVNGLFMDGVLQVAKSKDCSRELVATEAGPFLEAVCSIARAQDFSHGNYLDRKDFEDLLAQPLFQEVLGMYGIRLCIEPKDLFQVLDVHGCGTLGVEEVAGSLLQLGGSRNALHQLLVRHDLNKENWRLLGSLKACERRVAERHDDEVQQLGWDLCAKLQEVMLPAKKTEALAAKGEARSMWEVESAAVVEPDLAPQLKDASTTREVAQLPAKCEYLNTPLNITEGVKDDYAACDRGREKAARDQEESLQSEVLPTPLQAPRHGVVAGREAARLAVLLQSAADGFRLLDTAIQEADAELRKSLAKEAALEAELARREVSHGTQTERLGRQAARGGGAWEPPPGTKSRRIVALAGAQATPQAEGLPVTAAPLEAAMGQAEPVLRTTGVPRPSEDSMRAGTIGAEIIAGTSKGTSRSRLAQEKPLSQSPLDGPPCTPKTATQPALTA